MRSFTSFRMTEKQFLQWLLEKLEGVGFRIIGLIGLNAYQNFNRRFNLSKMLGGGGGGFFSSGFSCLVSSSDV
jgi:hypothetical protein